MSIFLLCFVSSGPRRSSPPADSTYMHMSSLFRWLSSDPPFSCAYGNSGARSVLLARTASAKRCCTSCCAVRSTSECHNSRGGKKVHPQTCTAPPLRIPRQQPTTRLPFLSLPTATGVHGATAYRGRRRVQILREQLGTVPGQSGRGVVAWEGRKRRASYPVSALSLAGASPGTGEADFFPFSYVCVEPFHKRIEQRTRERSRSEARLAVWRGHAAHPRRSRPFPAEGCRRRIRGRAGGAVQAA